MSDSETTIYGHDVDLCEPEDGVVTDVIVLARVVRHEDDGTLSDSLLMSSTHTTTGLLQKGIIGQANIICTDYQPFGDDE